MSNVLLSEYRQKIQVAAAIHGADEGAKVDRSGSVRWTAALGGLTAYVELVSNRDNSFTPMVRLGSSACLPLNDALAALATLEDSKATILRATAAWMSVRHTAVWFDAAPCDMCDGKGSDKRGPCSTCGGAGERTEVARG